MKCLLDFNSFRETPTCTHVLIVNSFLLVSYEQNLFLWLSQQFEPYADFSSDYLRTINMCCIASEKYAFPLTYAFKKF